MSNDSYEIADPLENSEKYLKRQLARKMWIKDPLSGRYVEIAALEGVFMKMVGQAVDGCLVSQDRITRMAITQSEKLKDAFKETTSEKISADTVNILLQAGIEVPEQMLDITPVENANDTPKKGAMIPTALDLI